MQDTAAEAARDLMDKRAWNSNFSGIAHTVTKTIQYCQYREL
jgi:hypothetical protein